MFRGFNAVTIDAKGRLAVPARFRELLAARNVDTLIMTISPWDRCIWAYPLPEWEGIDSKLHALPAAQGRVLVPQELRDLVHIDRRTVVLGQGNKLELWDDESWQRRRGEWLQEVASGSTPTSNVLASLSL